MANLIKSCNGILFNEDFKEKTLMWTVSPSEEISNISFGEYGLRIKHSLSNEITYTILEPVGDYCAVTKIDHIYFNENDIAGVIVFSSNKNYAECQSYLSKDSSKIHNLDIIDNIDEIITNKINVILGIPSAPLPIPDNIDEIYKYIKVHKIDNDYHFYAATDITHWIEVGNAKFEQNGVIGLFLYSANKNQSIVDNSHCYFKYFDIYKSKYISINGIDELVYDIEITNKYGNVLLRTDDTAYDKIFNWKDKICQVDTTMMNIPIEDCVIKVFKKGFYSTQYKLYMPGNVYGGDSFNYEQDIRLFINDIEVNPNILYDIGSFYNGDYYIRLKLYNFDEDAAYNKRIKILRYSEYYNGNEQISIADADVDNFGSIVDPFSLDYKKELVIDKIEASGGRNLYMRLIDKPLQDFFKTANDFRFKIIIE